MPVWLGLLRTDVPVGALSVFTRTEFEVADAGQVVRLTLGHDYDDGVVAWINGVEIYRSPEMDVEDPDWDTRPTNHESSNAESPVSGREVEILHSPPTGGPIEEKQDPRLLAHQTAQVQDRLARRRLGGRWCRIFGGRVRRGLR